MLQSLICLETRTQALPRNRAYRNQFAFRPACPHPPATIGCAFANETALHVTQFTSHSATDRFAYPMQQSRTLEGLALPNGELSGLRPLRPGHQQDVMLAPQTNQVLGEPNRKKSFTHSTVSGDIWG